MRHAKSNRRQSDGFFRPFEHLQCLMEHHNRRRKPTSLPALKSPAPRKRRAARRLSGAELFAREMADVTPIVHRIHLPDASPASPQLPPPCDGDQQALLRLENLVNYGSGFIVSDTPEYMEGRGGDVNPEVLKRLHAGDYTVQAHLDLHGFRVPEAKAAFDGFMKESVLQGRNAVLIVHGRGLSSPVQPVLKNKVFDWLTTGTWRKWVVAFTSARSCDGGAGATYVLLRRNPMKRKRKRRRRQQAAPS